MDSIALSIFSSRIAAVCEEMGAVLRRAALSPNIKDRLDFSCAVFDKHGQLCAQAAHIPVHLGSMAYAMADVVATLEWAPGDMVMLNDPYLGGTHLPDVTVIAPLFVAGACAGFVANRAHHADIGTTTPGSMPLSSSLYEEGMVISPRHVMRGGKILSAELDAITARTGNPAWSHGDFAAQFSANRVGIARLEGFVSAMGIANYEEAIAALNDYAERLAQAALAAIPEGEFGYTDYLDDDGLGTEDICICVRLRVAGGEVDVDFSGTASQVRGNLNCPLSVAAAGVFYVFRCLMPQHTPNCAGAFRNIRVHAPPGCLLNAQRPAAVAAGNVETSTRVVDVVLGALAAALPQTIPAASHGSMNNLALGSRDGDYRWDYYETIGGGMGAGAVGGGLAGIQTHMTNTLNTPIENLELHYPLRVTRYGLRRGSGGTGVRAGGDGLVREFTFLQPTTVTLLTERRRHAPWGLQGGQSGARGENWLDQQRLPGKVSLRVQPGQRLTLMTAGGGGWGKTPAA
jgi:N-methylhydantoinase B